MAQLRPRMYLLQPATVFAARVNQTIAAEYPVISVVYDGVTTGAYTDILPGMMLLLGSSAGADDYGRQRVRSVNNAGATTTVVWVGRSPRGTRDGELTIVDNAYITVVDDRRVWAKVPFIASDGEVFKDANLDVGTYTTDPPPVAVMGAGTAATIDAVTGLITVTFDGTGSYAVDTGATISTYLWGVDDGTITVGTSASSGITATFPAGFRYVSLKVTDSNGNSHTTYRPVFARDPDNDASFEAFQIESHRITEAGQSMSVRILENMPRATYPDGTLAMLWGLEPSSATDRSHMLMIGWLDSDGVNVNAGRRGLIRNTTLTLVDVAGRLDALPGFPQSIADDGSRDTTLFPEITWNYMVAPNLDKYLHYLLHWHSTALDVADFTLSGDGASYPFAIKASDGDSLWNQVDRVARAFVPDRVLTCDRAGRLAIVDDPMLVDSAERTATVQAAITEADWSQITFVYRRAPSVHWLRASAAKALAYANLPLDADSNPYVPVLHSIAPSETPGQGLRQMAQDEQIAISQAALNTATGHRYARANARVSLVTVTLAQDDGGAGLDWAAIEPALKQWVTLTVSADTAAQRGLTWTAARGLPKELNIRYNHSRMGLTRTVTLMLELETSGEAGDTYTPPVVPEVGVQPTPVGFVPPLPGDSTVYYGNMAAYVLWDGEHVFRTLDLQAASPTWEFIGTGITGTILDCQYFHPEDDVVGAWLLSTDGVWLCMDLLAASPSWTNPLTIAAIVAGDAVPATDTVTVGAMCHYWLQPGHLCVATRPVSESASETYQHAYFWVTEDYGVTWTHVDMNAFLFTSDGLTRGYALIKQFGMACFRSEPIIWAVRYTGRTPSTGAMGVFKSEDGGLTWAQAYQFASGVSETGAPAILHPFPDLTSASYIVTGQGTAAARLYRSTDGWATATDVGIATGYNGAFGYSNAPQRPNKRTFDDTHLIMLWNPPATSSSELLESYDQGATWTLLEGSLSNGQVTPNGWPPDVDQWVLIDHPNALGANTIRLTLDNFVTLDSKTGNLATVLTGLADTWNTGGYGGGFALPRVTGNT